MKRLRSILFLIIMLFWGANDVFALTGVVNVNDSLKLRDAPSTNSNKITSFYNGTRLDILDINAGSGNGCNGNWYRVGYGEYTGYSCGDYIVLETEESNTEDDSYSKSNYDTPPKSDGTIKCYNSTGSLGLRDGADGNKTGASLNCGEEVSILDVAEKPGTTCPYWYKIQRGNDVGYVCGYYVNTIKLTSTAEAYYAPFEQVEAEKDDARQENSDEESSLNEEEIVEEKDTIESYKAKLSSWGFPESYHPYLLELHARHPNWIFVAEPLSMTFSEAVVGESGNGASLLQGSAFNKGYLSTASHTYNLWTDAYSEYESEPGYYNASLEAIAYYMDPRTYLNEKFIFAFETLEYSANQDTNVISSIIRNQRFFDDIYANTFEDGTGSASGDIVNACSSVGISAVHVASRIFQEMGTSLTVSDSRLGGAFTYNGVNYSNYYNFFNIKSSCSNCSSIYAGYAFEKSWNTPYKGIYGGASFMYGSYISLNQDTLYYEKFDVSTTNGNYTHQYMQNLAAPVQESGIKYNSYVNGLASYLDTAITFVIPVYQDMPLYAVTAPRIGSANNYLSDLTIAGVSVSNFSYNTYNYNVYLEKNTTSIDMGVKTISSGASVKGNGIIEINSDEQSNQVVVTSESGKERVYTINFTRESIDTTTVDDAMQNSGFKYNDKYVYGIGLGTNASSIVGNISNYNHTVEVLVKDKDGNVKTTEVFKTGDVVSVTGSDGTKEYTVLVYGDVNGDGKISAVDYVQIKNNIMNKVVLTDVYAEAADVNKDGKISAVDYVQIKNNILGKISIVQ